MTDTTNTQPPLANHPVAADRWSMLEVDAIIKYGDARAAHAVAQMQGEPVAWVDGALLKLLSSPVRSPSSYAITSLHKGPQEGLIPIYLAPATAEQPAETREHILSAHIALSTCDGEGRVDKHHVQIAHEHIEAALGCLAATAPAPVAQAREITDAEIVALAEEWYDTGTGKDEVAHRLAMAILRKRQPAAIALANGRGE